MKSSINILLVKFSDLYFLFYGYVAFLDFSIRSLNGYQSKEFSMYVLMTISDENVPWSFSELLTSVLFMLIHNP